MHIEKESLLEGAARARGLAIIIDTFRAFSTACYAMAASPREYLLVEDSATAARLSSSTPRPFLIGKPELNAELAYDVPNSPTRVLSRLVRGTTIIHRSCAGARGILRALLASEVITGSLVNADAVARYVRARMPARVTLVAMGHEGETPSSEDDVCADYIAARIAGEALDPSLRVSELRGGAGRYFFTEAQDEYPREDFARCTALDRFAFVLRAERLGGYARLCRVDA
jgi:2-phosphosulfolactate phosphatase